MILNIVTKFVHEEEIIFIVSNFNDTKSNSSDIDIYCVTTGKSFVNFFYNDKHEWVELFVDNIFDVYKKINNVDEIAINFIREFKFVFGDHKIYLELFNKTSLLVENYHLPQHRKNLLKYRIKVLLSKYIKPDTINHLAQENFIINAISYPLIQLILEYYAIFPSSPKRWILQLQSTLPADEFETLSRFLSHQCNRNEIIALCERYAGEPDSMHIKKERDNNITSLS